MTNIESVAGLDWCRVVLASLVLVTGCGREPEPSSYSTRSVAPAVRAAPTSTAELPAGRSKVAPLAHTEMLLLEPLPGSTNIDLDGSDNLEFGVRGLSADDLPGFAATVATRLTLRDEAGVAYPISLSVSPRHDARWRRLVGGTKDPLPKNRWFRLTATGDEQLAVGEVAFATKADNAIDASFFTGRQPRVRDAHLVPHADADGRTMLAVALSERVQAESLHGSLTVRAGDQLLAGCITFEGKCQEAPAGAIVSGFGLLLDTPLDAPPATLSIASTVVPDTLDSAVDASATVGSNDWIPCVSSPAQWCWRAPTP